MTLREMSRLFGRHQTFYDDLAASDLTSTEIRRALGNTVVVAPVQALLEELLPMIGAANLARETDVSLGQQQGAAVRS